MSKTVACIIARTVSTRLPLKVLRDFQPHLSMLDFLIQRVKTVDEIDEIYLCTSKEPVDDILEDVAFRNGINTYRGAADEVIERLLAVGEIENADLLIRITGDNPFTSVEYVAEQIKFLKTKSLDYVRVTDLPVGATPEVFTLDAAKACAELMDPKKSEYLLLYMFEPDRFNTGILKVFNKDYSDYSLTVDMPTDFERSIAILDKLKFNGDFDNFSFKKVIELFNDDKGEIPYAKFHLNGDVKLPEGNSISYQEFKEDMSRRVNGSIRLEIYE